MLWNLVLLMFAVAGILAWWCALRRAIAALRQEIYQNIRQQRIATEVALATSRLRQVEHHAMREMFRIVDSMPGRDER